MRGKLTGWEQKRRLVSMSTAEWLAAVSMAYPDVRLTTAQVLAGRGHEAAVRWCGDGWVLVPQEVEG